MFMTGRGDPRAIFQPTYACNPDTDELQIELQFVEWQNQPTGGWICVRSTYDNAHEFRYYPPGNERMSHLISHLYPCLSHSNAQPTTQ